MNAPAPQFRKPAANQAPQGNPGTSTPNVPPRRMWLLFVAILLVNYALMRYFYVEEHAPVTIPYTQFREEAAKGNVQAIYSRGTSIEGRFVAPVTWPQEGNPPTNAPSARRTTAEKPRTADTFLTELPAFTSADLESFLIGHKVEISAVPIRQGSGWANLLFGFGPALLIIAFYVWMYRRASQMAGGMGMGGIMGIGKSRARRYDQEGGEKVTFADVAGIDEAENELVEIVDFLKAPEKYTRLGGSAPKGVLRSEEHTV